MLIAFFTYQECILGRNIFIKKSKDLRNAITSVQNDKSTGNVGLKQFYILGQYKRKYNEFHIKAKLITKLIEKNVET